MAIIWAMVFCCCVPVLCNTVKFGIDNLVDTEFSLLRNKRVLLVTHAAARTTEHVSTLACFARQKVCTVVRVMSPEHGYYGSVTAGVAVGIDTACGFTIQSLYGSLRKPDSTTMRAVDCVVLDLQDIGVRSYTYISTMLGVLQRCAEFGIPLYVLDRPNPLGGVIVDGALPNTSMRSFVCSMPIPYVHGCTIGELATMANAMGWAFDSATQSNGMFPRCSLTVVKMKRWVRSQTWAHLRLPWYPPSPNIPTFESIYGYATIGILGELGGMYIGIGSARPFTILARPRPFPPTIATIASRCGVTVADCSIVPTSGNYNGTRCQGWYLSVGPSTQHWKPYEFVCRVLHALHPDTIPTMVEKVMGSSEPRALLRERADVHRWTEYATRGVVQFCELRKQYELYPE
jgi:uncharacterized protein YbbC (DUF1343 family)